MGGRERQRERQRLGERGRRERVGGETETRR